MKFTIADSTVAAAELLIHVRLKENAIISGPDYL
jgi:hypothetical protein